MYLTYAKDIYAVMQSLMLPKEFVLYFDHWALLYFDSLRKLSERNVEWLNSFRNTLSFFTTVHEVKGC